MSHEIRNPLHAIQAYSQLLERDPLLGEAQQTKLAIVSSSGKLLRALINRNVLAELLTGVGFETCMASDGEGAVAIHAQSQLDLVLMDLRMPYDYDELLNEIERVVTATPAALTPAGGASMS